MSITTLQRPEQHPDEYRDLLALIDKAVADGVELRGQVAARPVGIVLTLGGRAHPLHASPTYQQRVAGLPVSEQAQRLRDPELRADHPA